MRVSELTIMKRRNLGNYEYKEVTLSLILDDKDSVEEAMALADKHIDEALGVTSPRKAAVKISNPASASEVKEVVAMEVEEIEEVVEEKPVSPKAKKAPKKVKEPEVVISPDAAKEEILSALRDYAKAKKSADAAKAVMFQVTKVKSLDEVDLKDYPKLLKALEV